MQKLAKSNILIIDSDPRTQQIPLILQEQGATIHTLPLTLNLPPLNPLPDLILLGVTAQEIMTSFRVCQQFKADQTTSYIPIIFMIPSQQSNVQDEAYKMGATDYITKPINTSQLLTRIGAYLQAASFQRLQHKQDLAQFNQTDQTIIDSIGDGMTNPQIATQLSLADGTVKNRVSQIKKKLGAKDRQDIARFAHKRNFFN